MQTLENGTLFGRYRVVRYLGSGISGECYQADDTTSMREVTLKLIQPGITLPISAMRQFAREMEIIASFDHPYLARVTKYGDLAGQLYVARHYVNGGSLLSDEGRSWHKAPFDVRDAFHYGQQLAEALDSIHRQGYVHGSLTLANILIMRSSATEKTSELAPYLLADIGLAHFVRRFGCPPFKPLPITTAPEQIGMRATTASDQYALAVIIYFWLTARPPFVGTPTEIEYYKLTETIAPLLSYNPQVTADQEVILRRALAVYPEERFPSILDFTAALEASLREPLRTLSAQPQETPDPAPETAPYVPPDVFQPLPQPSIDPLPQPIPQPAPEPLPEPATEPLPLPAPEPIPQPAPEPIPQPAPEPLPEPATEPLPQPAPESLPVPAPDSLPEPQSAATLSQQASSQPQIGLLTASAYFLIASPQSAEPYQMKLKPAETTIGRAGSSDIFLDFDSRVSRHHALLKFVGEEYIIYDRKSVSGVLINGSKISQEIGHMLRHGDHIQIGNYQLVFYKQPTDEPVNAYAIAAHANI